MILLMMILNAKFECCIIVGQGELYFEVSGECHVQLVIPGSTKLALPDFQDQLSWICFGLDKQQLIQSKTDS